MEPPNAAERVGYFREGPDDVEGGRGVGKGRVVRGVGGYQFVGDGEVERKEKARLELQESLKQQVVLLVLMASLYSIFISMLL